MELKMLFIKILQGTLKNPSRIRLWQEISKFAANIPEGSRVLDAGSGDAPYKALFHHTNYQSTDFLKVNKSYVKPTYICDLKRIPIGSNHYDFIIFTQVMEHLPEPKQALSELNRVLKPGGKMFYSAPFFFEEHEQPYDYYRYTQYGLVYLLESVGFNIERVDWLEGYFGSVAYQLRTMARDLPYKPQDIANGLIGYILAAMMVFLKGAFGLCSLLFQELEIVTKFTKAGFPKNYIAIVSKVSSCGVSSKD